MMNTWFSQRRLIYVAHLFFLMVVILPFLFWVDHTNDLIVAIVNGAHPIEVATMIVTVLTLDVFLPIPSSVVGNAGGLVLGWSWGFLSCFVGLTFGSWLGYFTGRVFRNTLFHRYFSDAEFRSLSFDLSKYGFMMLIACRGVPVLAEMIALAAGFHRFSFAEFFIATGLANLFLAALYTYLGVLAETSESLYLFGMAFMFIPVLGYGIRVLWIRLKVARSVFATEL
jgi:3-dehydroquinate synthase